GRTFLQDYISHRALILKKGSMEQPPFFVSLLFACRVGLFHPQLPYHSAVSMLKMQHIYARSKRTYIQTMRIVPGHFLQTESFRTIDIEYPDPAGRAVKAVFLVFPCVPVF